jgi:hypothetical protein
MSLHIRNKNDLFAILEELPPFPAIGGALDTGKAELLGGFERVPPSKKPGWIIRVTSRRGSVWNVVITVHNSPARVTTWTTQRIPWEHWAGRTDRDAGIYDGDYPLEYMKRRIHARKINDLDG